jgi:hypothetical protein
MVISITVLGNCPPYSASKECPCLSPSETVSCYNDGSEADCPEANKTGYIMVNNVITDATGETYTTTVNSNTGVECYWSKPCEWSENSEGTNPPYRCEVSNEPAETIKIYTWLETKSCP